LGELKEIESSTKDRPINLDLDLLKKRGFVKKEIVKLKKEISDIENFSNEMSYFGKTADIIYDYYELTDGMFYNNTFNKKENDLKVISETSERSDKIMISDELLTLTNLNKTRKIKKPVKRRNKNEDIVPQKTVMNFLLGADNGVEENNTDTVSKATLEDEYMLMMDKDYACVKSKVNLLRKCKECGSDMRIVYNESILCCENPNCAISESIFIESDMPSHKDSFNEKPKYPYKRIAHCVEKLNQFQSKGSTNVPSSIFTILEEEVKKHNMDKSEITTVFLEKILKKHKLSGHYENIMYIYSHMTGTPPMTLTREEIDKVLKMFLEAEDVYVAKYKPDDRHNFLKYSFVLHKIFLTLKKDNHAKYFKLLKSPWKMKQQEKIWKKICTEKGWDYYSS
jgi:hypothetical protein